MKRFATAIDTQKGVVDLFMGFAKIPGSLFTKN
jgi:hypothetical protein